MHFLLSNDDGYQAPGLIALASALEKLGKVTVVAPDRDRTGSSHSLSLDVPLYVQQTHKGYYCVNGTPVDCVQLALTRLLAEQPDMVISGINSKPNLGDDVLYSGTVAAAVEARLLGCQALAFSFAGANPNGYQMATTAALQLIKKLIKTPLGNDVLLNVNIPDLQQEHTMGYTVTRLGRRDKPAAPTLLTYPDGQTVYQLGPVGAVKDAGADTDFHAIRSGYISITPLEIDSTQHHALAHLAAWIEGIWHD